MRLILESKNNISVTELPIDIDGNYWIQHNNNNLLNVEASDNKWVLNSNNEIKITNNLNPDNLSNISYVDKIILEENNHYYIINIMTKETFVLYTIPSYEKLENFIVDYNQNNNILIGKSDKCDITINNDLFNDKELKIEYDKKVGNIVLSNLGSNNLFVNYKISNGSYLTNGDIIFKGGIFIYYFGSLLLVSNNKDDLKYNSLRLNKRLIQENEKRDYSNLIDKYVSFFDKNNMFQRPPRFKRYIEHKEFNIDSPTQKENEEDMPLIFTLAPMMTMGMTSIITLMNSMQKVTEGKSTLKDEMGSLIITGTMVVTMLLFPLLQNFYTKLMRRKKERKRRRKYKKYIDSKNEEIKQEIEFERQVLIESNLEPVDVRNIILNRSRNLWERKLDHGDFLDLRLGIGNKKPDIEIKYPESHFTMEEDDLKDIMYDLVDKTKDIENVPISLNFRENNKVGIIGNNNCIYNFIDNLMLQIMAYHGYDMLRIVILTNDENKVYWDKYKNLPYIWNNNKSVRFYAVNKDDVNKLTSILMEEYNYRKEMKEEDEKSSFTPYYLIITDDVVNVKNNVLVNNVLKEANLGYSIVMVVNELDLLPNECSMFINITEGESGLFENHMRQDNQIIFKADVINFSLRQPIATISNIPMDINSGKFLLPTKYGFLEMYDVGNVNQLNILNRWKNNDIINSLSCPVGIDEQGELFNIDLHEKAHGPHGLVAGMTGSGKSEWIITYILSMAINYSPEEVQFVLIDYKGGGLALTFDNRENNIKLPHVVGTITNLDVVEIKRSLASIEAELKRRQAMFKKAREELNESSMDIYKYQELYRAGKLKEPMSHLFIISDEFAELKAQQPEFMDELISTARIGRSLGVHLILATQKPSGVVNDQIWSNSKFRICLKVQDKSDSNEMIMCPDAALLKETGRFFLQVGYNEFFAKGQSAYAGVPYFESDKKVTEVDSSVDFVDELGAIIKRGDIKKNNTEYVHKGEELPNILNYIIDVTKSQTLNIKQLWLSRIPGVIYVDKIKEKYGYQKEDYYLNPVIGEYDNPSEQSQNILSLPISKEGNVIIYGASGSGKENLLTTIMYSVMTTYTPQEAIMYVIDFGSEVLNAFDASPHVGDIVHSEDDEKIDNIFKMLNTEIDNRRKILSKYNGSFAEYVKSDEKDKIPNMLVLINQADVFLDLYDNAFDFIANIVRDCSKYGIYFVITSSSISSIKSKISQYFTLKICLQLNDDLAYKSVLGNSQGLVPSKMFGRGLIKQEKVVEFQTAYAMSKDTLYNDIANVGMRLFMQYKTKARNIPVLPEKVSFEDINKNPITIDNIPVGIIKQNLGIASIDVTDNVSYTISSRNFEEMDYFIDNIINVLSMQDLYEVLVFDAKYKYEDNNFKKIQCFNSNYDKAINKIKEYTDKIKQVLIDNNHNKKVIKDVKHIVCIILGLDTFITSLNEDMKKQFGEIISNSKDSLKVHFIYIDVPGNYKKYEFENWYKDSINQSNGLWIGDGFAEQFAIKATKIEKSYYEVRGNKYGYIVKDGAVDFIKLLETFDNNSNK